ASWPVAVLHTLGTGSDVKSFWLEAITVGCVAVVVIAVLIRVGRAVSATPGVRVATSALAVATPIGIAIFTLAGPLQKGWARRAGTPPRLLGAAQPSATAAGSTASAGRTVHSSSTTKGPLDRAFSATLSGTASQNAAPGGAIVELSLRLGGGAVGTMRVRMGGTPLSSGG